MNDVLIEYESSGSERGEVQRMRVTRDEAVAAADRIRASGGTVLEWWLVADVRGLGEKPSGKSVRRRIELSAPPDDLACIVVPHVPYRSQIAKDNAQAAKDLAHLLRLLGVDSYEEATVVLFDLTRRGHLPAATRAAGCQCGPHRRDVTAHQDDSVFWPRHGCANCNLWDGPPRTR